MLKNNEHNVIEHIFLLLPNWVGLNTINYFNPKMNGSKKVTKIVHAV